MTTIHTHLFSIDAPDIFEKALWMGQLIRLERMDRGEGESSFAEVNFFVGLVSEERLDFAAGAAPAEILDALWTQYLDAERRLAPLPTDAITEETHSPRSRLALVKLAATDWRPVVGQLVWIDLPMGTDDWVFARFTLEFDWKQRDIYEPLGHSILASLDWKKGALSKTDIAAQASGAWSIFDTMEAARREAITLRYREILGQVPRVVAEESVESVKTMDLRKLKAEDLTVQRLDDALALDSDASRRVRLKTAFLPDPIELTCPSDDDDDSHSFGEATVAIVRALQSLGAQDHQRAGELLWEHCKICFDATDYGAGDESNQDFFGIHGPADAFAKAGEATIYLSEAVAGEVHEVFALDFYPPWEDEHGCSLVVRDGALVGYSDPGGWLGAFASPQA